MMERASGVINGGVARTGKQAAFLSSLTLRFASGFHENFRSDRMFLIL
jgi:hypothetical protein